MTTIEATNTGGASEAHVGASARAERLGALSHHDRWARSAARRLGARRGLARGRGTHHGRKNIIRHRKGIRISGFTTVLGVAAMVAGFFSMAGIDFPVFPVLLIAVGAQILYGVSRGQRD